MLCRMCLWFSASADIAYIGSASIDRYAGYVQKWDTIKGFF